MLRERDRKGRKEREGDTDRDRERTSTLVPDDLPMTDSKQLLGPEFHKISLHPYNKSPSLTTSDFKPLTRDAEATASLRLHQVSHLTKI